MLDFPNQVNAFSDPLKQRLFMTPEQRKTNEQGLNIVRAFYRTQTSNESSLNFFRLRSIRWQLNNLWSKGSNDTKEFLSLLNVSDGNKAWFNGDYTPVRIAPQFINTLVESMAKTRVYPSVKAVDSGSVKEKEERYQEALYLMHEKENIAKLQEVTGMQLEPPNAMVPQDELSAKVYFALQDQLPKEIRFQELLKTLMKNIKFENIMNRKTIRDEVVFNFVCLRLEKTGDGDYTIRKCIPVNMVYNFFMNDTGECEIKQIGEFYSLKVIDIRDRFGKSPSRPNGLDEKQIFELAKLSHNKNIGQFNYVWQDYYMMDTATYSANRPYDDCSVIVLDCVIDFPEDVYYVAKKDAYGKEDFQAKKTKPYQQVKKDGTIIEQEKPEDVDIIKKQKSSWMRGVYAPYGDVMLYWGTPDVVIPDFTNQYKTLCPYCVNIPNNDGDYIPSLMERIMEPLREYQLIKLKRKQIISLIEPDGFRVDVETARDLDLGDGNTMSWEEVVRIKRQTGIELWSSKGLDPLKNSQPPISAGTQSANISKIIELSNVLASIVQEIRQLIGVPMYRDGSDVGDRTAAKLAEGQNQSSFNVTDFALIGNNQAWQEAFYKYCLLHWNDMVRKEPESSDDLINTKFDIEVKFKSTEYQNQLLEQDIQRYSQVPLANGDPALGPEDAMMLREIDDPKMAQWYMVHKLRKNKEQALQESMVKQQQNAKEQAAVAQQTSQGQLELAQQKAQVDKDLLKVKSFEENKTAVLKMIGDLAGKGMMPPPYLAPIIQELIPNITIPIAAENQTMQQAMMQPPPQQIQGQEQQDVPPDDMQQA